MTIDSQQSATKITPRTRSRRRWVWVIVAVVMLLILLFFSAPSLQNGSTYSRSPKGYRSWFDYMEQRGHSIERWQQSYNQLRGTNETLIRIAADLAENRNDSEGWLDFASWVEQGNTLIVLTWKGKVSAAPFSSDLTSSVGPVRIETTRRYQLQPKQKTKLKDPYGTVVWSQTMGKGQVILAAYPWLGANIYADQPGNYRFLEQLVPTKGQIWVDERVHGYREHPSNTNNTKKDGRNSLKDDRQPESLWLYLAETPIAAVAAQWTLLAIIWIWGHNHRFGMPVRLPKASKDNSQQYIQALAGTLNYADQRELVLIQLSQFLRQTLAHRLGLRGGPAGPLPNDAILTAQWAIATGRNDKELLELLQQAGQQLPHNDRALLAWVSKADAILQDIP